MTTTPLTDFLATLADPATHERFRADPGALMAQAELPPALAALVLHGHSGAIRIAAVKELEAAGLSPRVSPYFGSDAVQQPNMNSFTSSSFTSSTYASTSTDNTTTTFDTNTTSGGFPDDRSFIDIIRQSIDYFARSRFDRPGALVVVGSGIRALTDLTMGAEAQIRGAQKVLYCVADPVIERRIHRLNPASASLYGLYGNDKPRIETYVAMVDAMLSPVRAGQQVCAVFYGHPGVFAWSTHQAIRIARREGYRAEMQAAVSADASLFADLGIDPSRPGCHSLEATDFLIHRRRPDTTSHVLLWQAECAGDAGFHFGGYRRHNFPILVERLQAFYPVDHPVVIYEAASLPHKGPHIAMSSLDTIRPDHLTGISTLYLPPAEATVVDHDMCRRLGLPVSPPA